MARILSIKLLTIYHEVLAFFHPKNSSKVFTKETALSKDGNRTLVGLLGRCDIFQGHRCFFGQTKAVSYCCYTLKICSLIHTRHNKTPYELVHDKKHDLTFFRVFGALCYLINDSEDLGKLQPTADIGIFIGYAPSRKGYRIYNKRTQKIMETIHVQFDVMSEPMAHV
ncbi:retrovirus-related pol polyprotein from transposon TNT 1-94 [Tanacetum coccineum]